MKLLPGWTRAELNAAEAQELDWLLEIDDVANKALEAKVEAAKP